MAADVDTLRNKTDEALSQGRPADAACYLAELSASHPDDRETRVALAISLGDAGYPAGALKILRSLADHLAHGGFLLPAMVVIRHGLEHAPDDPSLLSTLKRLHVRGVRAKAGNLPIPPPLRAKTQAPEKATARAMLALEGQARLEKITELASSFRDQGQGATPKPMPLFSELDEEAFLETVKHLHYQRREDGTKLLIEGERGDTLLIIGAGEVRIEKAGNVLATVKAGSVLGEMALITGAPRSATAIAQGTVETFELSRADVEKLAASKPKIAEELVEYCRKRLIANLLRTSALFERFDDDTRYDLIGRFKREGVAPGTKLIEQGQPGRGLFVVAAGEVEVAVAKEGGETTVVANLKPGDVFGEISLLKDQPTNASVTARGRVGVLFLPRDEFRKVLDEHPEVRKYLEGLSDDRIHASDRVHDAAETLDAEDLIVL